VAMFDTTAMSGVSWIGGLVSNVAVYVVLNAVAVDAPCGVLEGTRSRTPAAR
jgi:hypothetical protein